LSWRRRHGTFHNLEALLAEHRNGLWSADGGRELDNDLVCRDHPDSRNRINQHRKDSHSLLLGIHEVRHGLGILGIINIDEVRFSILDRDQRVSVDPCLSYDRFDGFGAEVFDGGLVHQPE